jgi:hypothetical protein
LTIVTAGYDSIRNNLAKTPLFTRCMVTRIRVRTSKPGCCTRCCRGDMPPGDARPPAAAQARNNLAKTPLFTRCMVRCLRIIRRVLDVQSAFLEVG